MDGLANLHLDYPWIDPRVWKNFVNWRTRQYKKEHRKWLLEQKEKE